MVDYLELVVYHDHDHHIKEASHRVFQICTNVYSKPLANQGEFPIGSYHNLDAIRLRNNSLLACL